MPFHNYYASIIIELVFLIKYIKIKNQYTNYMESGNKIINQIINCLELHDSNIAHKEPQSRMKPSSSQTVKQAQGQIKQNKTFVLKKINRDLRSKILHIHPSLSFTHVYKVFGMIGINEKAISVPDFEESVLVSQFYGRGIQKIQIYRNAILIDLSPPDKSSFEFTHEQITERFKSHGNMNIYNLALQIEELTFIFNKFISTAQKGVNTKNDSITKYLDSLGDSMFFVKFGFNKAAISKKLLQYLDYDLEQFVIEAVKYKTIFHEIFSSNCYLSVMSHCIKNIKYLMALLQKSITLEEFNSLSTFNFVDYIYSKDHVRSYCDFTLFMPTPNAICIKITNIRYKQNQLQWKQLHKTEKNDLIDTFKKDIRQKQYSIIDQLKEISSGKIAGYKTINHNNTQQIKRKNN